MDKLLEVYATIILEYGLKLETGEKVLILFDENGIDLARRIASKAYQNGAADVRYIFNDSIIEKERYRHGSKEAINCFPKFEADYQTSTMLDKYHSINLVSFSGVDPDIDSSKVAQYKTARAKMMTEAKKLGMSNHVKWVLAPVGSYEWAQTVYPRERKEEALKRLWSDLFKICRVDVENPLSSWAKHNQNLKQHTEWLNKMDFDEFHFEDQYTNLTVGLANGHIWCGGENVTKDGKIFLSNIPTEEVYTIPNKYKVNGHVKITRPFMLFGELFTDLVLYFEEGQVVRFETTGNRETMSSFLETDEGSNRLGEIALVDKFSPINQLDYPFYQILIDENACSHLALGSAYDENINLKGSSKKAVGYNESSVHLDFMIGSDQMNVTGKSKDGAKVVIMKEGTWVV